MRLQLRTRSLFKLRPSAWAAREGAGDVVLGANEEHRIRARTDQRCGCTSLIRVLASSAHRCAQRTVPANCIP
jgi:hypothetical protein